MKLLDSSDHPFEIVHDFIFDRTRSIRQDLSMQNIFNDRVIWTYEKMVWVTLVYVICLMYEELKCSINFNKSMKKIRFKVVLEQGRIYFFSKWACFFKLACYSSVKENCPSNWATD